MLIQRRKNLFEAKEEELAQITAQINEKRSRIGERYRAVSGEYPPGTGTGTARTGG